MKTDKIKIEANIAANKKKVWEFYTSPTHIVHWNFASEDWCCPSAENNLKKGGRYRARMEAKDGSFGFDLEGIYTAVEPLERLCYEFDNREVSIGFKAIGEKTQVVIEFDPETENPVEMQEQGWQAILNNFKTYTESH